MTLFILLILMIMIAVQFYYQIKYLYPLSIFKEPTLSLEKPLISVLVCAHNEAENLKKNIPFILNQNYPSFEVIVVNDRSTDATDEVLKNLKVKHLKIEQIAPNISPKKNAISKGVENASGEYILLTDADCSPISDEWILTMAARLKPNTDLVLGTSTYIRKNTILSKLIDFDTFFTAIQYLSFALRKKAYMGVGRNLLMKKSAFENAQGFKDFETMLAGDDDIIVQKIAKNDNVNICISEKAQTISEPKENFNLWFAQKRRHLTSGLRYSKNSKFNVGLFQQTFVWQYPFLIAVVLLKGFTPIVFVLLYFKIFNTIFNFGRLSKKININFNTLMLPILEILYVFCYLLIGFSVLIKPKQKWI